MAVHHSAKCKCSAESTCDDSIDWDAVDKALEQVSLVKLNKRPKGFTVQEYARKKKIAPRTAREHLTTMYRAGLVERTIWKNETQKMAYVYRLTNGTKA